MFSVVLASGEALREALKGRVPIGETSTAFPGCHLTTKMINPETIIFSAVNLNITLNFFYFLYAKIYRYLRRI